MQVYEGVHSGEKHTFYAGAGANYEDGDIDINTRATYQIGVGEGVINSFTKANYTNGDIDAKIEVGYEGRIASGDFNSNLRADCCNGKVGGSLSTSYENGGKLGNVKSSDSSKGFNVTFGTDISKSNGELSYSGAVGARYTRITHSNSFDINFNISAGHNNFFSTDAALRYREVSKKGIFDTVSTVQYVAQDDEHEFRLMNGNKFEFTNKNMTFTIGETISFASNNYATNLQTSAFLNTTYSKTNTSVFGSVNYATNAPFDGERTSSVNVNARLTLALRKDNKISVYTQYDVTRNLFDAELQEDWTIGINYRLGSDSNAPVINVYSTNLDGIRFGIVKTI